MNAGNSPFERAVRTYRGARRADKVFLLLFLSCFLLQFLGGGAFLAGRAGMLVTGFALLFRLGLYALRRAIWRLRNRLIVAYIFIAVVPVMLVVILAQTAAWVLAGQIGTYLIHSEYERRLDELDRAAKSLSRVPRPLWPEVAQRIVSNLERDLPGVRLELSSPKGGDLKFPVTSFDLQSDKKWDNASGLMVKARRFYLWAHYQEGDNQATIIAPITQSFLNSLAPGVGKITLGGFTDERTPAGSWVAGAKQVESPSDTDPNVVAQNEVPRPANFFDLTVTWGSRLPSYVWEYPGQQGSAILGMTSRIYSVFNVVFSKSRVIDQGLLLTFLLMVSIAFLVVEMVSLVIGVSITKTITSSVHSLYEGTQRVTEGDFTHRIEVRGKDQLAELAKSFNLMTGNLERLLSVEKERERLQTELEIAREVQTQLHPHKVPDLRTLSLTAMCDPARMVSGDYYDYQSLGSHHAAIAIGDVAGKGISAALLMATVQSSLRTQLRFSVEAAASGDGALRPPSTAELVSQLNQQLFASTSMEKYATFCIGIYDEKSGLLTYTNAGHLPPILIREGEASLLDVNGMVVGAFPFAQYGQSTVTLQSGDLLVMYTDGITEPENEYGEMFAEERLIRVLTRHFHRPEKEILRAVLDAVREWTGSPELQDDMTLMLARRL